MNIEQIKIFCDLVETKSFSKTASRNLISQSAVSQQIKNLEQQLKFQLIDRTSRPFTVTQAGKIFFEGCKEIYSKYEELCNKLAHFAYEITGSVRITGIPSVVIYLLQPYIRYYLHQHPKVKLYVEPTRANQAVEAILDDEADFALIAETQVDKRLAIEKFYEEQMLLTLPPKHPLGKKKKVPIKALQLQPLILFERDQFTRKLIDRIFKKYGITIKPVMELDSIETMKRGIEAGVGLGILPGPSIEQEISIGTLVARPIEEEQILRPVVIVYRKGKIFSEPVKRFLKLLKEKPERIKAKLDQ